jgi:hypothetical protein
MVVPRLLMYCKCAAVNMQGNKINHCHLQPSSHHHSLCTPPHYALPMSIIGGCNWGIVVWAAIVVAMAMAVVGEVVDQSGECGLPCILRKRH